MKYFKLVYSRIVLITALFIGCNLTGKAQSDTSFWFAAPAITPSHENTPEVFRLTSYDKPADITISEPDNPSFTPYHVQLAPYTAQTVDVTSQLNLIESRPAGTVLNCGIHIKSSTKISAYYDEGRKNNPEIFPLKGSTGAGFDFLIPAQTRYGNWAGLLIAAHSGFIIVATQDNTTVTITLSKNAGSGVANTPFTVTLNRGQVYSVIADGPSVSQHLGGSFVNADKPVNVTIYDDSVDATTDGCAACSCKDLIGDQIVPIENTGQEFIIVRGDLSVPNPILADYYYVWAIKDNTTISVNGVQITTINKGQSYEGRLTDPSAYIVTSNNVYVYQLTGINCEMASTALPSIKCTGSQLVSFIRATDELFQLNLLCKSAEINRFVVNGKAGVITPAMFQDVPGTNGVWKAARIDSAMMRNTAGLDINAVFPPQVTTIIKNTSGLFHLGFLNGSSFTGGRLGYFSNYATVQSSPQVASASCIGSNIQLSSTLVSGATYSWTGPGNFTSSVNSPVITNADINSAGMYYLTASLQGCGTSVDSVLVTVHPLPTAAFTRSLDTVCYGNTRPVNFTLTGAAPWAFVYTDGAANDTLPNIGQASSFFTASPVATTVYKVLSITDANSCEVSGVQTIKKFDTLRVNPLPVANFAYSSPACEKNSFQFAEKSVKGFDPVIHWSWVFAPGDTLNTASNAPIPKTFSAWGTYPVSITVQSSLGCNSLAVTKNVLVNPLPRPGFVSPEVCLKDAFAPFKDTTGIADNSSGFTYFWNFGDSLATPQTDTLTTKSTTAQHHYHATAVYGATVTVTSAIGCVDSVKQFFTVNGDIPKAGLTFQNIICSNTAAQIVNTSSVNFGSITQTQIIWGDTLGNVYTDDNPYTNKIYLHKYPAPATNDTVYNTLKLISYSGISCKSEVDTVIGILPSPVVSFSLPDTFCLNTAAYTIADVKEKNSLPGSYAFKGNGVSANGVFDPVLSGAGSNIIQANYTADDGCVDSFALTTNVLALPVVNAGPDQTILVGANVLIPASASGTSLSFKWLPSTYLDDNTLLQPTSKPPTDISYTLRVTGIGGCINTDTVLISVLQKPAIPNAFSPNGDGINDKWEIKYLSTYLNCEVRIFNRSGQIVFSSVGYSHPWDGTYHGKQLPIATYYYIIDTKLFSKVFSGSVTILR